MDMQSGSKLAIITGATGGVGYADATNPGFKKKRKAECEEMQATFSANLAPGETMECTLK